MIVTEDSFYVWLRRIREHPGAFLGEKSLTALVHFWNGYAFCRMVETKEESTNHSAVESYDERRKPSAKPLTKFSTKPYNPYKHHFMNEFDVFVYAYYNCEMTVHGWANLISRNSNSDEEAFDKFFELLDEFLAQKGDSLP